MSVLALAATMALGACGYAPLYGQGANRPAVTQNLSRIAVAPIDDRPGQMMRTALERRLTPRGGARALYSLNVDLNENLQTLAEQRSGFVTRANLTVRAKYTLTRTADGAKLAGGTVKSVASYNILESDYATLVAKGDARERAIDNLADTIHTRLGIYFSAHPEALERTEQ